MHRLPCSLLPRDRKSPSTFADTRPLSSRLDQARAAFGTGHTFLEKETQTRSVSGVEYYEAFREKQTGVATRDGQTSSEKQAPCPHPPPLRSVFSCFPSERSGGSKTFFFPSDFFMSGNYFPSTPLSVSCPGVVRHSGAAICELHGA